MIKPTVGRVLWFYPSIAYAASIGMAYGVPGEPLTALIAHVINDNMVNLSVFDQNGKQFAITSVPLVEENVPMADDSMNFHAVWMPYQKGQAAKAEALENKPTGDMPTPTTAQCSYGFNDRSFVTRDLVMSLISQGKPTEHIQHDVPLLLELIYGVDPAKAECDRGPDIELVHTSLSDAKRSATPVDLIELPATSLTFGEAIQALKAGHKVARSGWNGKGMFLSLSCDGTREVAAENFWSPHNAQFARENGGTATVLPSITMKTATGEILMGWLASQTDMLAEDWVVLSDQPVGYEANTTEGT